MRVIACMLAFFAPCLLSAQSGEPEVTVDQVRAVHYPQEGFQLSTVSAGPAIEKIIVANGGQVVAERTLDQPEVKITLSKDDDYEYLVLESGDECDWRCRCFLFYDIFWQDCNGLGCGTCERCRLTCPAPPSPPPPIILANSPSTGIEMDRYQPPSE